MRFSTVYNYTKPIGYPGAFLRYPLALLVAHYLVVYGEPEKFYEFFYMPYYYPALLVSLLITIMVSEFIYWSTKTLDYYFSWLEDYPYRISSQIIIGVALPLVVVYWCAKYYFSVNGAQANLDEYWRYDYNLVACFIIMLNSYYLIFYVIRIKVEQSRERLPNMLKIPLSSRDNDWAIIYAQKKSCVVIDFSGKSIFMEDSLENTIKGLLTDDYFMINRSDVIHYSCIEGYFPNTSRTLELAVNESIAKGRKFIVSQRKAVTFKRWYVGRGKAD